MTPDRSNRRRPRVGGVGTCKRDELESIPHCTEFLLERGTGRVVNVAFPVEQRRALSAELGGRNSRVNASVANGERGKPSPRAPATPSTISTRIQMLAPTDVRHLLRPAKDSRVLSPSEQGSRMHVGFVGQTRTDVLARSVPMETAVGLSATKWLHGGAETRGHPSVRTAMYWPQCQSRRYPVSTSSKYTSF